jgi:hypothetical protein
MKTKTGSDRGRPRAGGRGFDERGILTHVAGGYKFSNLMRWLGKGLGSAPGKAELTASTLAKYNGGERPNVSAHLPADQMHIGDPMERDMDVLLKLLAERADYVHGQHGVMVRDVGFLCHTETVSAMPASPPLHTSVS